MYLQNKERKKNQDMKFITFCFVPKLKSIYTYIHIHIHILENIVSVPIGCMAYWIFLNKTICIRVFNC